LTNEDNTLITKLRIYHITYSCFSRCSSTSNTYIFLWKKKEKFSEIWGGKNSKNHLLPMKKGCLGVGGALKLLDLIVCLSSMLKFIGISPSFVKFFFSITPIYRCIYDPSMNHLTHFILEI